MNLHPFKLDNGLTAYHLRDSSATAASVQVWYRVGSAMEEDHQRGIAHLLEHMMFKGTGKVPPEEHAKIIQNLGGQSNAFTSEEVSVYYQTLPAEHYRKALELEADRMQNLTFPEDHFLKERNVVIEEYSERILNQPIALTMQKIRRSLFQGHPFAIDAAGVPDHVRALTREDMMRYYRRYYHPGNATLAVSGPMEESGFESCVRDLFGTLTPGEDVNPVIPPFPQQTAKTMQEDSPIKLNLYSRVYFLPADMDRYHRFQVLNLVLGDGENAVLKRKVESSFGVLNAGSLHYPTKAGELFIIYAAVLPMAGIRRVANKIDRIMKEDLAVSETMMEEVRGRVRIQLASQLNGTEKKASKLGEVAVLRDRPEHFFEDDRRFADVSSQDLVECFHELRQRPRTDVFLRNRWFRRNS